MKFARFAIVAALVFCLAALAAPYGARAEDHWLVYVNDRYGTRVSYPAPRFAMQPPPVNDDGRTLIAGDGAEILVFGANNVAGDTLASKRAALTGPDYARTTYRANGANWFAVSGYRNIGGVDSVFYEKYILSRDGGVFHSLIVTYPSALKRAYDPIVERVAASFASGE
ncbi:MAG TPA: hypothetical protein VEF36_03055 [Roseiarcus sp.]|nr:hypothetical protein [Roseiarcus sp.]